MDIRALAVLVFLASLAGLLLLEPPQVKIADLSTMGKLYKVCGELIPLKKLRKGCIYRFLDESGEIKAISFFGECMSGYFCVYGRLEEYRGELEVVILSYG